MAWWQKFFSGTPDAPPSGPANQPSVIDVVPGKLAVHVRAHPLQNGKEEIPCWTYVTAGLKAFGQKEFIFTLRREPHEDPANFPQDPLKFFGQIANLAKQGQLVDVGGYTCFRVSDGFLGEREQVGMAYVAPQPLGDLELPPPKESLAAILLRPAEAEVVPAIGSYRVTTLLGQATRYYPCPSWSERKRKAVLSAADFTQSLLSKMGSIYIHNAVARTILPASAPSPHDRELKSPDGAVHLLLPRSELPTIGQLLAKLPASGGVALLTDPDPAANGRLVWSPGQEQPQVIAPPGSDGSCLTGGFVALMFGEPFQDAARIFEDGFAVTMCPATWERVSHALRTGTSTRFAGSEGKMGFELDWQDDLPQPTNPTSPTSTDTTAAFEVAKLLLYQPDDVLKQRLASSDNFIQHSQQAIEVSKQYWAAVPESVPQRVTLVIAIKPGRRVRFWTEFKPGNLAQEIVRGWIKQLEAIPVPVVWQGPVAVAIHAKLWGGADGEWEFLPREWKLESHAGLLVPDGILDVIWPD